MTFNKRNIDLVNEIKNDIDAVLDYDTDDHVNDLVEVLKVALDNAIAESKKRRKINREFD